MNAGLRTKTEPAAPDPSPYDDTVRSVLLPGRWVSEGAK